MYVISILMTLDKIKADRGGILRGGSDKIIC